jgi:hypothetical protein
MIAHGIFYTQPSMHALAHEPKLSYQNKYRSRLRRFTSQLHNLLSCFPQVVGHFQFQARFR